MAEDLLADDDKGLREMFINLKSGIDRINEKINNPTCHWNECDAGTFDTLSQLVEHVDNCHVTQYEQSVLLPTEKTYI